MSVSSVVIDEFFTTRFSERLHGYQRYFNHRVRRAARRSR